MTPFDRPSTGDRQIFLITARRRELPMDLLPDALPLHGPYDPVRTADAAHLVHELVRYLNYATKHPGAVPGPGEAYETVGSLRQAAAQLPQAFGQVGKRVGGECPEAGAALREAALLAMNLAGKLSAVQSALREQALHTTPQPAPAHVSPAPASPALASPAPVSRARAA
jgi:hypothetical protein